MNVEALCSILHGALPTLFVCAPAPNEGILVRTPLLYPDGGIVDIFVVEESSGYLVTDYGEALGWLGLQSSAPNRSRKQQAQVEDVCHTLGIELVRGQLMLRTGKASDLGEAAMRLAQAVVRVSDLWFTLRNRALEATADEVDDWLRERKINFERQVRQRGRSGREWTIDFQTRTVERSSLVFLLSTGARGATRRLTEHVLAGCVDLSHLKNPQGNLRFVSLFDDTEDVWRADDFSLLEDYSEIAQWSRPDELERILTAPLS